MEIRELLEIGNPFGEKKSISRDLFVSKIRLLLIKFLYCSMKVKIVSGVWAARVRIDYPNNKHIERYIDVTKVLYAFKCASETWERVVITDLNRYYVPFEPADMFELLYHAKSVPLPAILHHKSRSDLEL